jgi:hypothetical protein
MSWVQMIVDWERKGAVEVDTLLDVNNGVGGRVYRGLATRFCLAHGAEIDDEEQLLAWIEEQLGDEIRDLVKLFIVEERNGEEFGVWADEGEALYKFEESVAEAMNYLEADTARAMGLLIESDAHDYLSDCNVRKGGEVCGFSLTRHGDATYIAAMAKAIEEDARSYGFVLTGTENYLEKACDEMQVAWDATHMCPLCGTSCPESMLHEDEPSWECLVCAAEENEED